MRYQDWPQRLNKIMAESQFKPFAWGEHDCCLFAANVVRDLTGADPGADLRGAYSTALEAARILKASGGVRGVASQALGAEVPPLMAQRGDVVLVMTEEHGDTLAVCIGAVCVAPGPTGLASRPLSAAVTAWRVA